MPTICELTIELKKKGIKGYSGKTKQQMMNMLEGKEAGPKPESKKKQDKKPEPKKEDSYKNKSVTFLKKMVEKLESLVNDKGATAPERAQAKKKLKQVQDALKKKEGK